MKIYIHIGCGIFTQDSFKYNHSIIINSMHTSTSTNSFQIDINGIIKLPKSINDEENEEKRVFDLYICAFYKRVNGWNDIIFPNPLFVK